MSEKGWGYSVMAHAVTGLLAVISMIAWNHLHPADKMAKVDIVRIISTQQKALEGQLKQGMSDKERQELIAQASNFGKRLDFALAKVAQECECTLINSAAVVRDAPQSGALRDYTTRILELAQAR